MRKKNAIRNLIVGVLFIGALVISIIILMRKDSKDYGEEFLNIVTNPQDLESTQYYRELFESEGSGAYTFEDYSEKMQKDYGKLMTDRAFEAAVANRFIPWDVLIRDKAGDRVEVDGIDLKKMKEYDDGRIYYGYLISIRVFLSNGENEAMTVSGDLVMMEEGTGWLVDAFRWNSDYEQLNQFIFPNQ